MARRPGRPAAGAGAAEVAGVLVVDKPAGPTSFEVVNRVRRALGAARAGHTGTLDPLASGVLAVCLGEAVKLQQYLTEGDKAYQALVAFGAATDTQDGEGEVVARGDATGLSAARVAAGLASFRGPIAQLPPMFSAVRVGGRRLHQAARRGEEVERKPRQVVVHALDLLAFEPAGDDGLARTLLSVRCGKGTYVRALADDLGKALGVPAHLAGLRRTAAGPFELGLAIPLAEVERLAAEGRGALLARLVPPARAVGFLPGIEVDEPQARALRQGKLLSLAAPASGLIRALDSAGELVALCLPAPGGLRPVRVWTGANR